MTRTAFRTMAAALGSTALFGASSFLGGPAAGAAALPVSDPNAVGVIGLCGQNLQPIDHGSVATAPFVWLAAGATAAAGQYAKPGGTATLYGYQPRPSVPATEWSGAQLTASGHYTNAAHPMAQATHADSSLADFVADLPPQVDGLIELRLYLGGPQLPLQTAKYDATFVRVTGSTWSVAQGGTVSCTSGKSESLETAVLPSSVVNPPPSTASAGSTGPSTGTSGSTGTAGTTGAAASPTPGSDSAVPAAGSADLAPASADKHSASHSSVAWVVLGVLVLLAVGLTAWLSARRRRPA